MYKLLLFPSEGPNILYSIRLLTDWCVTEYCYSLLSLCNHLEYWRSSYGGFYPFIPPQPGSPWNVLVGYFTPLLFHSFCVARSLMLSWHCWLVFGCCSNWCHFLFWRILSDGVWTLPFKCQMLSLWNVSFTVDNAINQCSSVSFNDAYRRFPSYIRTRTYIYSMSLKKRYTFYYLILKLLFI